MGCAATALSSAAILGNESMQRFRSQGYSEMRICAKGGCGRARGCQRQRGTAGARARTFGDLRKMRGGEKVECSRRGRRGGCVVAIRVREAGRGVDEGSFATAMPSKGCTALSGRVAVMAWEERALHGLIMGSSPSSTPSPFFTAWMLDSKEHARCPGCKNRALR